MKITELFSDRKAIGHQYLIAGVVFLAIGITMTRFLRWHSHHPDEGQVSSEFCDSLSAIHGTILVFFGFIPVAFAAFGNLCMPLGPRERMSWAFLDSLGLLLFYSGVIGLLICSVAPSVAFWNTALIFNFAAWLASGLSFIRTIFVKAKGGWLSLPFFIWSLLLTSVLLLVALLLLEFAVIMQLVDVSNGSQVLFGSVQPKDIGDHVSRLWYHFFWFVGHPEVYVLMFLVVGLFIELVRLFLRKIFRSNGDVAP